MQIIEYFSILFLSLIIIKYERKKGYFGDFQVTFYFCNTNISEFFDLTKS